jgi:uroporphyrinogen decarboxylase
MMRRYNADDPVRFAPDFAETVARLKNRTEPLTFGFSGAFWQLREWLGFENLCMLFHDDPAWVGEMIAFWDDFMCRILKKLFQHIVPDVVLVSEDMAYKSFSMISPAMTREFIFPSWKRWGEIVHAAGVPVYDIDSDGFIGELIPLWIEANFQACNPIEVAAGNDIVDFRKRFGRNMAYHGGVDKRAMAKGGRVIEEEIRRIAPVIRDGGFIPSCDHGIPSDVSWPNFVHYVKLLAKETGWE